MFLQMVLQVTTLSKLLFTDVTRVRLLPGVFTHVNLEIASESEMLVANFALMLFDTFVDIIVMSIHFKSRSKRFWAHTALKGLVPRVGGHVTP
jgi:hypothetical protein